MIHFFPPFFTISGQKLWKKKKAKHCPHRCNQNFFFCVYAALTTRGLVHKKDTTVTQVYNMNINSSLRAENKQ